MTDESAQTTPDSPDPSAGQPGTPWSEVIRNGPPPTRPHHGAAFPPPPQQFAGPTPPPFSGSFPPPDDIQRPAAAAAPYSANQKTGAHRAESVAAWSTEKAERPHPTWGLRGGLARVGIKLNKSSKEQDYDRDVLRMRRKLAHPQTVLVVNLKGGIGKSTQAVAIGSTLAQHRHDVAVLDATTDGSIRRRMPIEENKPVTSDIQKFLHVSRSRPLTGGEIKVQLLSNKSGLAALVSPDDTNDYRFGAEDYRDALLQLHREYRVTLVDMSPDRSVPAFWPAIQSAHAIILVATPTSDCMFKTQHFIDLLRAHRYEALLSRTVLVWNNAIPGDIIIDVPRSQGTFVSQLSPDNNPTTCLVDIPLDPHLASSGEINLALVQKRTRRQLERAAALVMDKLPDWSTR